MDKYADVLEDLNKACKLEPNDARTLQRRGATKVFLNASALEDLNKANKLEPNDVVLLHLCGEVKRKLGDYAGALEDLDKALELEPNNAFSLKSPTETKRLMEKYVDALEDLDKANELEPNNIVTLQLCGEVKRKLGNYTGALENLDKAFDLEPKNALTLKSRAETKQLMEKYIDALEDLNKACELEPNDAQTLQRRGAIKVFLNDYASALEDLNKANEFEPNNIVTLLLCGKVKRMLGDYGGALEDLDKALEFEPKNALTLKNRGEFKRLMEKYEDALEDLNKAKKLKPNDTRTFQRHGAMKGLLNDYASAWEDLDKALQLDPNNTYIFASHAETTQVMGKYPTTSNNFDNVVARLQLEKGEGSSNEVCKSSMRNFDIQNQEVGAKDERIQLFLSYSNEMRDFAMRLCLELKSSNYNVIDQNSINFIEVVDQCQVAIVVLSNMYLNSRPLMMELCTIVMSKKTNNPTLKVYPLLYNLTLKDLLNEYVSSSAFGEEGISLGSASEKEALNFLLERKNELLKKTSDLVQNLSQSRIDVGEFCKQFFTLQKNSWPSNGLEFMKNSIFEEGSLHAILEEIFYYVPTMKECNIDQGYQGRLEIESKLSLRQMKPFLDSLLVIDHDLWKKLNTAQYLQEKYIQYSSFEEMCPLNLEPDQKHEYSKGRITAALFPSTFLYHFKAQMLRGYHDENSLPMLKATANMVAHMMQQKDNKNAIQTSTFFDFVDSGVALDPKRIIAMCCNFPAKTSDGSKHLVIIQDDLSGAYYYQFDEDANLEDPHINESIGVIGVHVTSTDIHVDNIHEDGSSYSGVLEDFSYKFDFDENKQCAAEAFGDLVGTRFLSENSGLKCSPLLIIALASAIQKKGLRVTWSNGKGHMQFDPKIASKVKVKECACQIQYKSNINHLGVEIEWGTSSNSCVAFNQIVQRGTNEIVDHEALQAPTVDKNVVTSISKNVGIASTDCVSSMVNQIAIYDAAAQSKTKRTFGIKVAGSGVDIGYEKHDSRAKKIMIITANDILKRHYELKGGFEKIPNLDVKHPNLKNYLLRCQLHEVHDSNYLVVSNVHSAGHVSVYLAIEQNNVVPKFELIWITDILIEGGKDEIKRIFEIGLKGRELTVKRNGSNFTQVGNPSKPLAKVVPGYQESLVEFKSRFPSNAITSSMVQILEPSLVGMLRSKNEWRHIIGPQGRYGMSDKYWWNATFMQAIVYSRTMYKSGKLLKPCIELPINVIGHIGFCNIEEPIEDEFVHLCGPMLSRGKFSRPPGSLLGNKVLWGGLEIEPKELENLYSA